MSGYPAPGSNYPVVHSSVSSGIPQPASAYYEPSSIGAATLGLWRRTFTGMAITSNSMDSGFPSGWNQVESMPDQYVGFGSATDVSTNYSMEWTGYFKPAVTGDFNFVFQVDDYLCFWIGANAVSGYTYSNSYIGASAAAGYFPLTAGKYYPIRMRYTEIAGGNECSIWAGLNNTVPVHNTANAAVGQFFFDNNSPLDFPVSGLIT